MEIYYQAGYFEDSPATDLDVCLNVPEYRCAVCGQREITNYYNYPNLDARFVLDNRQIAMMGPKVFMKSSDEEMFSIVQHLRQSFNVPVTSGTIFGPTRLKITNRPKVDFHVLIQHAGLFCRRPAVDKLLSANIDIRFVTTPATGKYAALADYVEIVVPVAGHNQLPEGKTYCAECYRYSPDGTFKTVLISPTGQERDLLFFKTIEKGTIVFSKTFIELLNQLNITGFVEGKTLLPVQIAQVLRI